MQRHSSSAKEISFIVQSKCVNTKVGQIICFPMFLIFLIQYFPLSIGNGNKQPLLAENKIIKQKQTVNVFLFCVRGYKGVTVNITWNKLTKCMYNNKRIIQYFMNERNQACWICAITVTLYVQSLPGRKEKDFSPCRLFPFLRRGLCKRNKSLSQAKLMVGRRRHSTGPDKFNEMKSGAWHTRERERERNWQTNYSTTRSLSIKWEKTCR